MSKKEPAWKVELIRQAPVPTLFLIASFFFYKFVDFWPGLILLIISIIYSVFMFKDERYLRDIRILEKRVKEYHQMNIDYSRDSRKNLGETAQMLNTNFYDKYGLVEKHSTDTE